MTTIQIEKREIRRIVTICLMIIVILMAGTAVCLSQIKNSIETSRTDADAISPITIPEAGQLTASAALAAEKPILFVFTPVEQCAIQYCLTADNVEAKITADVGTQLNIVEVPVYAYYICTADTPPFLLADWDLYPVAPYSNWLPVAEMTDFGWGLAQTQLTLVMTDGQEHHNLGNNLDMTLLDDLLKQ